MTFLLASAALALVVAIVFLRDAAKEPEPQAVAVPLPPKAVNGSGASVLLPSPRESPFAVGPLAPAPAPGLTEESAEGPLPVVAADGREAWRVYGRPFDRADERPRLAIVISGLGLSDLATEKALSDLPAAVTLSFLPSAGNTAHWLQKAREKGHETLLDLSLEPFDDPRQYVGPRALFTSLELSQNLVRLHWVMSRGTGYIGLTTYMGTGFAQSPDELEPILHELKKRGLAFFDARTTEEKTARRLASELRLPRGFADRILDAQLSAGDIDDVLASLGRLARHRGSAIGVGSAYPETIAAVARWLKSERGVDLVPLSAILVR
jgi:uncharacterized protein